jgi:predicted ferric reductase
MTVKRVSLAVAIAVLFGFGAGFYLAWAALLAAPETGAATTADGLDHTAWYLARAGGVVAYLLLFGSVALGLALSSRGLEALLGPPRLFDLHEFVTLLTYGFVGLHLVGLYLDPYLQPAPAELLVPFALPYRPTWSGLGAVALYLAVVITASFYLRRYLRFRTWRALHYLTFVVFLLALLHGLGSGTDTLTPWMRLVYVATGFATVALVLYRIATRVPGFRRATRSPADVS